MKTDIREKDDQYELAVDLPGFKKDEINLDVKDGYLTISAQKGLDKDEENKIADKLTIKKLVEESKKIFERDIHILDILWLNGILGYVNNEQVYFYMNHNSISTCLDQNYDEYVLRSCMIDALDIKNLRSRPVI